jgi:hypothetical protein
VTGEADAQLKRRIKAGPDVNENKIKYMRVMRNFGIVGGQVVEEVRVLGYLGNLIKMKNKFSQ